MSDKQLALDAISILPEGATIREILDKIEFLAAIKRGSIKSNVARRCRIAK